MSKEADMARSHSTETLFTQSRATEDALRAAISRLIGGSSSRATSDDLLGLATGPLGQTVLVTAAARAWRSYPLATVLAGAGLAWLTLAPRQPETLADRVSDQLHDWQDRADAARESARDRLMALYDSASDAGTDAAAFAREKASVTADLAADLAGAFGHGLSDLGTEAADRIMAARERAYAAFASGADAVHDQVAPEDERNFMRRHPVASAAVAVALGAALATALQANRRDGGSLQSSAEDLLARARAALDTETTTAGRAITEAASALRTRGTEAALAMMSDLTGILEQARTKAQDLAEAVEEDVEDKVEDAGTTLRKTARRAGKTIDASAKRVSAETRDRRRATQKLAEKLTREING
jgi:hypothetical protein